MTLFVVWADTDNYCIGFYIVLFCVAKLARLFRSARGIVFGIEKQHYILPLKIFETHLVAIGVCQCETRSLFTYFKHRTLLLFNASSPPTTGAILTLLAPFAQGIEYFPFIIETSRIAPHV